MSYYHAYLFSQYVIDAQANIKPLCHDIGIQCNLSESQLVSCIPSACSTPVKEPPCPNFSFDETDDDDEFSLYEPLTEFNGLNHTSK